MHASITTDRVIEAVRASNFELSNPGFCVGCGADADGVEPDAERYECEECGKRSVYGAEQVLIMGAF